MKASDWRKLASMVEKSRRRSGDACDAWSLSQLLAAEAVRLQLEEAKAAEPGNSVWSDELQGWVLPSEPRDEHTGTGGTGADMRWVPNAKRILTQAALSAKYTGAGLAPRREEFTSAAVKAPSADDKEEDRQTAPCLTCGSTRVTSRCKDCLAWIG